MSIQILGGAAKGLSLDVPPGDVTRPTSVMLRRKLFDARQDLNGFVFVDLFAGSGAVGLEALSRGAAEIYFCESNKNSQKTLKSNVQKFLLKYPASSIQVYPQSAIRFLDSFGPTMEKAKKEIIIFIDPPYEVSQLYVESLKKISSQYQGEIWLESDVQKGPSESFLLGLLPEGMGFRRYDQGTNFVIMAKF